MSIRITLAKAFVVVIEKATDIADDLLRTEAKKAYNKLDTKLTGAQQRAEQARLRIASAERTAAQQFSEKLSKLNSQLEDRWYVIPTGKSPDAA